MKNQKESLIKKVPNVILTIYNLPDSMKRRRYEIAHWLRQIASDIEKEDPNIWNKKMVCRYNPIKK